MDGKQILDLPMDKNDSGADTVRGYLKALLLELWAKGEGFGGKRPFGNSGWEYDLYISLIKGGAVDGTLDNDGYVFKVDEFAANTAITEAINAL